MPNPIASDIATIKLLNNVDITKRARLATIVPNIRGYVKHTLIWVCQVAARKNIKDRARELY